MDTIKNIQLILSISWIVLMITIWSVVAPLFSQKEKPNIGSIDATTTTAAIKSYPDSLTNSIQLGKNVFKTNCASCHNKNMRDKLSGPALAGTSARWAAFPKEDLYNWIRNSPKLIVEKHPRALTLFKEWNGAEMTRFPNLTDEQIEALLNYIDSIN